MSIQFGNIFGVIGSADYPFNVSNFTATGLDDTTTLRWTDPSDDAWVGTKIVVKIGGYPVNEKDGITIVDSMVRNAYQTIGFQHTGLENGVTYYYQAFPYSEDGISNNIANRTAPVTISYVYPLPLVSFSINPGNGELTPVFTLPANATSCRLVYKTGSFSSDMFDGTVIEPAISGTPITGLTNDETYYFRAFPRNEYGRYNEEIESNTATGVPTAVIPFSFTFSGDMSESEDETYHYAKLLTSGVFKPNVQLNVDIFLVGGGGGTGTAISGGTGNSHPGGGGGYTTTVKNITLSKDTDYNAIIGAGGPTSAIGGTSQFLGYQAGGGKNGVLGVGGAGGSGGGGGRTTTGAGAAGQGGSNGSNGGNGSSGAGGAGQGTTTRAFGEATGELFAGGGGAQGGVGGAGGGGGSGLSGATNTGGGCGGGSGSGTSGGSGIIIVRIPK